MQYGIWKHINEFFTLCYIKTHYSILHLFCTGHLKNTEPLNYADLPNVNTLHCIISIYYIYEYNFIRKSLSVGSCQVYNGRYNFPKIPVFIWKPRFYHWQQIWSVVSLEVMGSVCSFLRKYLPYTHVSISIDCQTFFQVKWCSMTKKVASSTHNSNNCTNAFPQNNLHTLVFSRSAYVHLFHHPAYQKHMYSVVEV